MGMAAGQEGYCSAEAPRRGTEIAGTRDLEPFYPARQLLIGLFYQ